MHLPIPPHISPHLPRSRAWLYIFSRERVAIDTNDSCSACSAASSPCALASELSSPDLGCEEWGAGGEAAAVEGQGVALELSRREEAIFVWMASALRCRSCRGGEGHEEEDQREVAQGRSSHGWCRPRRFLEGS